MLSRKIPKLKLDLKSKGRSRYILLHKYLLPGIPVLSIFALVGIAICSFVYVDKLADSSSMANFANFILPSESNKAYAEEGIAPLADTSASLTVDDGKIKDTIFATSGEFAYASHKITVEANNIKSYSLTLTRNIDLTGPSTIDGAAGKTPDQMDNAWGYAFINDGADPTSATYQTLNNSNTLTGPAIDSNHNLSGSKQLVFGAKFGNAAASGTYHAEATLSLVATPRVVTNYIVNVNCNSGTNCTSTLNTTSDEERYVYTISSTTPTRSGYKFLGYNTTNTTTANANYAPGKTVTLTAASPTLTLYAIWQEDANWNNITTMQQMTAEICANAPTNTAKTFTDNRSDNHKYSVTKLSDGNCWMTQNLALDLNSLTLKPTDSNVTSNWASTTGASALWDSNASSSPMIKFYKGSTSYGNYYSWHAATAGNTSTSGTTDATNSICPSGWRLPSYTDYQNLSKDLTYSDLTSAPYNFTLSGDIYNNSIEGLNGFGGFWSRTPGHRLYVRKPSGVNINTSSTNMGFSVRCVAYSN